MTREGKQARLEAKLNKILTPDEKRLLSLITIESRKDKLLFRMPKDFISLDSVWCKILEVGTELGIHCAQADMYATLSELDDVLGDVKWLWKDWLPRGFVSMLVGDPGIGKSMVALDIVDFITKGNGWPTSKNSNPCGTVVWIDTEASQQLLRMRSKKMCVDRGSIYLPIISGDILGQIDIMNDTHREAVTSLITSVRPSLIVVDSLGGSHTRGENKFEEIAPIMKFFALVARDEDIAVLMTHHLNKGMMGESPEVSLYRIRGSTAIPQFARSIMALEKVKDNEVKLRMIKSNLAKLVKPLTIIPAIDSEGDIIEIDYKPYEPVPAKRNKQELCSEWMVQIMKDYSDGIRIKNFIEIAEGYGYSKGNLYTGKTILGDRIQVKGTGREAYWFWIDNVDRSSVDQIMKAKKGGVLN